MKIRRFMELLAVINPLISFNAYHVARRKMINSSPASYRPTTWQSADIFFPIISMDLAAIWVCTN